MVIVQNGERKMKLFEKLKKDHNTEPKFSFRDALGNMKSAVIGKASDMRAGYKSKADQAMQSDEMLDLSSKLRMHKNKVRIRTAAILTVLLVVSVGFGIYHHVKVYRHYTLVSREERTDDNATQYVFLKKYP